MSIDLRSDTVTKPTPAMLEEMFRAEVGDDVYGEDPTVRVLEEETARLLGKEAALFVPSGTMANQLALAVHTRPGDSVIAEAGSHLVIFESGGAAALSGVQFELTPREERLSDKSIDEVVKPASMVYATTTLLTVENTHNLGRGRVLSAEEMARIAKKGKALGLATHCDGARIWNAAAALGTAEHILARGYDTISVCFSKGLGAPVGSAICGPSSLIDRARKLRKRWGGGMRQAGYLAAGALFAIRHNRGRLVEDHRRAADLAELLTELARGGAPLEVEYPSPGTNLVYFRFKNGDADVHIKRFAQAGVLVGGMGSGWIRAAFHLDIDDSDASRAMDAIRGVVRSLSS